MSECLIMLQRLMSFLSVRMGLGSGSITGTLGDTEAVVARGIKFANGRKKWSRTITCTPLTLTCIHCPLRHNLRRTINPPSTPWLKPRLVPFTYRRHIRLLAFPFSWNVLPSIRRLYKTALTVHDDATLNRDLR